MLLLKTAVLFFGLLSGVLSLPYPYEGTIPETELVYEILCNGQYIYAYGPFTCANMTDNNTGYSPPEDLFCKSPYDFIVNQDCSKMWRCAFSVPQGPFTCPDPVNTRFSRKFNVCVWKGGEFDDCRKYSI